MISGNVLGPLSFPEPSFIPVWEQNVALFVPGLYLSNIMSKERNDFWERERECERFFAEGGPYYFITTEDLDWLLYTNKEEFVAGTNFVGIASGRSGFVVLDDVQMNNHHHVLGEGTLTQAYSFKDELQTLNSRYQTSIGHKSLKDWNITIEETTSLQAFRNRAAYTDRNAYMARLDSMPSGYPWGSANLFFNGNLWMMKEGVEYGRLGIRAKKAICHSHDVDLPSHFRVLDGMLLRASFVDYKKTERLFNSANKYFTMLTKHGEADVEIAAKLGENIQIPNEEVFQIVCGWFPGTKLRDLDSITRMEAAKMMKLRLRSSNRQIIQILNMPAKEVACLFPQAK